MVKNNGETCDPQSVIDWMLKQSGKVFVDVGAFTGYYVLALADKFNKVYAFEPYTKAYEILKENIKKYKKNNVILFNKAVYNITGKCCLKISSDGAMCVPADAGEQLNCITLSDALRQEDTIDLIKIDTEGNELPILQGAEEIIPRVKKWMIEIHNSRHGIREFLIRHKYSIIDLGDKRYYAERQG